MEEDLAQRPAGHATLLERNAERLKARTHRGQIAARERHMVDASGRGDTFLVLSADQMHDRPVADIEPSAGETERGPVTVRHSQHVAIEFARTSEVGAVDCEVVQTG